MKNLRMFIPIVPIAKARARVTRTGHAYTPKETAEYEAKLKKYFEAAWGRETTPMSGPIMVEAWFYMPRPKSVPKKKIFPDTKPDIDNLEKAVYDALDFHCGEENRRIAKQNKIITAKNEELPESSHIPLVPRIDYGKVIDNDSRIVSKISHKRYFDSAGKPSPGVEIVVRQIDSENITNSSIVTPIAAIFTGEYDEEYCRKVRKALMLKNYCPIFLDIGEDKREASKYTSEVLKITELLCVIENHRDTVKNPKLDKTISIAEVLGKEIFKLTI
jgi:Holliday junction resolvase RusA-like endonuclease